MDKTILITGANGFVGRHLVAALSGSQVYRVMATDIQPALFHQGPSVPVAVYRSGDLADPDFVASLCREERIDTIVHLAAVLSQTPDMATYFSIMNSNIRATFLLLEAARLQKTRFVFPSTALVYGNQPGPFTETMVPDPGDFYALSKLMSEQLIRFYGNRYALSSIIFRIGILYGPSQTGTMFIPALCNALLSGKPFLMTPGEQKRDFVNIRDFIRAIEHALERRDITGTFNIGSGQSPTLIEVARMAGTLCHAPGLVQAGALAYREKESWEYCLNPAKMEATFGWQASVSLEEGLSEVIAFEKTRRNLQ